MKLELQVPSPFPEMFRQFAPEGVKVEYPASEVIERRGGLQDINWVEMTISWGGSALTPIVIAFIARYSKRLMFRIKNDQGSYEDFTPEIIDRMLKNAKPHDPKG